MLTRPNYAKKQKNRNQAQVARVRVRVREQFRKIEVLVNEVPSHSSVLQHKKITTEKKKM